MRMDEDGDIPDYVKNFPLLTDDKIWSAIESKFSDFCDVIFHVSLETKEQAVHQRHGVSTVDKGAYLHDPEVGGEVRSWLQIPFDPTRDVQHFLEILQTAKNLADTLRLKISDRNIDVKFLQEWGSFCRYAAVVELEYLRERPNLQHLKGAASQSRAQHKRWYAHVFMRLRQEGDDRKDTDLRVLGHIYDLIEKDHFPDPAYPRIWFEKFIGQNTDDLTRAFQEGQFKLIEIEQLAKSPTDDLPSFEISGSDP
jgi:hypothetical protein